MQVFLSAMLLAGMIVNTVAEAVTPDPLVTVLSSAQVSEGQVAILDISLDTQALKADQISVNFLGKTLPVFPVTASKNHWYAFLSVPVGTPAGDISADIAIDHGTNKYHKQLPLTIAPSPYATEILKVSPSKVKLSAKDEDRTQKESEEVAKIYATPSPEKFWDSKIMQPIGSRITSPFGSKRLFNGELQSFHSGDDLRAMPGTPVKAAAQGVIRLAKNLFFAGNCVIVDHGMGLFTSYAHLSKFRVKIGQKIKQGQVVGLSGATGRVSGPHLHWGARVNEVVVSPVQMRHEFQKVWR